MIIQNFKITNLTCDACVKLSTKALKSIPGIDKIIINQANGLVEIESSQEIAWDKIYSALHLVGKEAVKLN